MQAITNITSSYYSHLIRFLHPEKEKEHLNPLPPKINQAVEKALSQNIYIYPTGQLGQVAFISEKNIYELHTVHGRQAEKVHKAYQVQQIKAAKKSYFYEIIFELGLPASDISAGIRTVLRSPALNIPNASKLIGILRLFDGLVLLGIGSYQLSKALQKLKNALQSQTISLKRETIAQVIAATAALSAGIMAISLGVIALTIKRILKPAIRFFYSITIGLLLAQCIGILWNLSTIYELHRKSCMLEKLLTDADPNYLVNALQYVKTWALVDSRILIGQPGQKTVDLFDAQSRILSKTVSSLALRTAIETQIIDLIEGVKKENLQTRINAKQLLNDILRDNFKERTRLSLRTTVSTISVALNLLSFTSTAIGGLVYGTACAIFGGFAWTFLDSSKICNRITEAAVNRLSSLGFLFQIK